MVDAKARLYEGLFLLDQRTVASDFDGCLEHVRQILCRADAEVLILRKWDERRLAYEIQGQKRGTYLMAYFRVDGSRIVSIERDCNLSEDILRAMIIKCDHISDAELTEADRDSDSSLEGKQRRNDEAPKAAMAASVPPVVPPPAETGTQQQADEPTSSGQEQL